MTGFPLTNLDRRPRKRARLGWDVLPEPPKVLDLSSDSSFFLFYRCCFFRFGFARSDQD